MTATRLGAQLPGLGLCGAVAAVAYGVAWLEGLLFGRVWVDALVLAILAGAGLRTAWTPPERFGAGIALSAKTLLEVAVVLIGANVSAAAVMAAGWKLIAGIALVVVVSFVASYGIGRALGLGRKLALLIAAGNSICGNSAIAAVAPVIDADSRDVAASIAFTAVLGVIVVLILPLLAVAWSMPETAFGVLAGLTVYAVPQVLAATAPISSVSAQVGAFVKLIRVLMLGPMVVAVAFADRRAGAATTAGLMQFVPWFIIGFLVMMALRSFGLIPVSALPVISGVASILTVLAMAALGLGVDLAEIAGAGPRVIATVTLSMVVLGAIALGLIRLLGL